MCRLQRVCAFQSSSAESLTLNHHHLSCNASLLQLDLKPTSLWRDEGTDWWSVGVQVPPDAVLTNFAFTAEWNGEKAWDNNWGECWLMDGVRSAHTHAISKPPAVVCLCSVQLLDSLCCVNMPISNADPDMIAGYRPCRQCANYVCPSFKIPVLLMCLSMCRP